MASFRKFQRSRVSDAHELYHTYNERIFGMQLPKVPCITWNKRLRKTAGMTLMRRRGSHYTARIELSVKVCLRSPCPGHLLR